MNDQPTEDDPAVPRRSPADLLGPRRVLAVQEQGHGAGMAGEHVSACPWAEVTSEQERALRAMWLRGYAAGRTDLRRARTP